MSIFWLSEQADAGDLLWQKTFRIKNSDHATEVYAKVLDLCREAMAELVPRLNQGELPREAQDSSLASFRPKRSQADGQIHWDASAERCYNLIRALARPYPGAHSFKNGCEIKLWRALPPKTLDAASQALKPGSVIEQQGHLLVRAADGLVEIVECSEPGLQAGDLLGDKS